VTRVTKETLDQLDLVDLKEDKVLRVYKDLRVLSQALQHFHPSDWIIFY
jgi:hypothetical protein